MYPGFRREEKYKFLSSALYIEEEKIGSEHDSIYKHYLVENQEIENTKIQALRIKSSS